MAFVSFFFKYCGPSFTYLYFNPPWNRGSPRVASAIRLPIPFVQIGRNEKGKFEIKMLPSDGWKRVLRPPRAQLLHNLMGQQRKLPVSNRQVALRKTLKIGPLLYHWVSHLPSLSSLGALGSHQFFAVKSSILFANCRLIIKVGL